MMRSILNIHPFDPWGDKRGGIETFIRLMLTNAPEAVAQSLVGVSEDPAQRPLRDWVRQTYGGRALHFYGLHGVKSPNRRGYVPLNLRFALQCRAVRPLVDAEWTLAHRIEPVALGCSGGRQTALFLHADPAAWTGEHSEVRWRHFRSGYRWLEQRAIEQAHRVYCVNQTGRRTLIERYGEQEKFQRFYTTYRPDCFYALSPAEREQQRLQVDREQGWPTDAAIVLFAARMEAQKDPALALEAFAQLLREGHKACLAMIGEGTLLPSLKQKAQTIGIDDQVLWLGGQPPETVAAWMQCADLFLLSSRYEGMPIAVLEAQACGLPVISTPVEGVQEIVQHGRTGWIASGHSAGALAKGLVWVLRHQAYFSAEECVKAAAPYHPAALFDRLLNDLAESGRDA